MLLNIFVLLLMTEAEAAARLTGQARIYHEKKAYCYRKRHVPEGCGRLEEDECF